MSKIKPPETMAEVIEREYAGFKAGDTAFFWSPVENSVALNIELLRQAFKFGYRCIYVSLSKDVGELLNIYGHAGLDTTRVSFIDGITQLYSSPRVEAANVTYVASPLATSEILEMIKKSAIQRSGEKILIYFDSLTSILIYNSPEKADVFIRDFADLIKELNAVGIGVSVSIGALDIKLLERLKKISGKIIDLTGGAK